MSEGMRGEATKADAVGSAVAARRNSFMVIDILV